VNSPATSRPSYTTHLLANRVSDYVPSCGIPLMLAPRCIKLWDLGRAIIMRHFIHLRWFPNGRFVYRMVESGGVGGTFVSSRTDLAKMSLLLSNFKSIDILQRWLSLHILAPPSGHHPSTRCIRIVSTEETIQVFETTHCQRHDLIGCSKTRTFVRCEHFRWKSWVQNSSWRTPVESSWCVVSKP